MTEDEQSGGSLEELRREIDRVDEQLLSLLRQRLDIVSRIGEHKRAHRLSIRDFARERQVLASRGRRGAALGLPGGVIESVYRLLMLAARDHQAAAGVEMPLDVQPRRVAVIGGAGQMGSLLVRLFADLGHEVRPVDRDTPLSPEEAARWAQVVIVSVPIAATEEVIRQVGPLLAPDALLMDVTSVKQGPLSCMLHCTRASVLGTHPMFGPGVHSLQGQRVVLCPGRGEAWQTWLCTTLRARGLVVTEASAEQHDRMMAVVQVLTHFQTQVLGLALSRFAVDVRESRPFTSPAYLMELYVAARHFAQDPELYGPIEMLNPMSAEVTRAFSDAAAELRDILARRDQAAFRAMFEEVRAFFGDFTHEALEQSAFLIDRLVERTLGDEDGR